MPKVVEVAREACQEGGPGTIVVKSGSAFLLH
eukprot:SAG31_NODE_2211_length_6179_cov_2.919572_3_plen_32_part_00